MNDSIKKAEGLIHSFQSLGAVDGPGVRFVVFFSGCNLRCACCHNPDTHTHSGAEKYTAEDIVKKCVRYKEYFGSDGGITLSGGEPLLQPKFAAAIFSLCKEEGINTCLDTSGSILNEDVKSLLSLTDRVLLDIKYTKDDLYEKYVGCKMSEPLAFLDYLNEQKIKTTVRQVIIPSLNDTEENLQALKRLVERHPCVDKTELLPFRKVCQTKYDKLGIPFPLSHLPEPSAETMKRLGALLK